MSESSRRLATSPDLQVRAAWGTYLLVWPGLAVKVLGGRPSRAADWVMRVLGARHLLETGLELRHGSRWQWAGVMVDALHAASALGFAQIDDRWRRVARADALVAAGFAAVGFARLMQPPFRSWAC